VCQHVATTAAAAAAAAAAITTIFTHIGLTGQGKYVSNTCYYRCSQTDNTFTVR